MCSVVLAMLPHERVLPSKCMSMPCYCKWADSLGCFPTMTQYWTPPQLALSFSKVTCHQGKWHPGCCLQTGNEWCLNQLHPTVSCDHHMTVTWLAPLQLFIQDNQGGEETTVINHIGLFGTPHDSTNMKEFKRVSIPYHDDVVLLLD